MNTHSRVFLVTSRGLLFAVPVVACLPSWKHDEAVMPHHPETHQERPEPINRVGGFARYMMVNSTSSNVAWSSSDAVTFGDF